MLNIKNVVVAGAGGNLGPYILDALHSAGFKVSALQRSTSKGLPAYVNAIETDFTPPSLLSAFTGQDAVVSCIGVAGVPLQVAMIDAADEAGVKRFIPSEFGWAKDRAILPELAARLKPKEEVFDYLVKKCETSKMTWSAVAAGPFLDWSIKVVPSLGFNLSQRTARIVDSGNESVTGSTGAAIGAAAAGMLVNLEKTANRFLKIRSVEFTQNGLLSALEGAGSWQVSRVTAAELRESKARKIEEKRFQEAFLDILALQLFEDGAGRGLITPKENDNELLGVKEESVDDIVRNLVSNK